MLIINYSFLIELKRVFSFFDYLSICLFEQENKQKLIKIDCACDYPCALLILD